MNKQNQIKSALAYASRTCQWLAEQMTHGSVTVSEPQASAYLSDLQRLAATKPFKILIFINI